MSLQKSEHLIMHGPRPRATAEEIIDAYRNTGSVWKAGKLLGLSGQTVHGQLRKVGHEIRYRWTDEEIEHLKDVVGKATIGQIADDLGRSYAAVAAKIHELQIGQRFGNKRADRKIPRGQGYDKATVKKHIKALESSGLTMSRYAKQVGIKVDTFVLVVERHFPEWWIEYRKNISYLPEANCAYCGTLFHPSNSRQVYCSRICGAKRLTDESYFGGNRRSTIGLAEGVCQICRRKPTKGLSSHHVIGKENDPENELLIALCAGCHNVLTALAARDFDAQQWEALITLTWMRHHGAKISPTRPELTPIRIKVALDTSAEDFNEEEAHEGWAQDQFRAPLNWYAELAQGTLGFPVSGDATAIAKKAANDDKGDLP